MRWDNTSATVIATDIINLRSGAGFTANVEAGLPTLERFEFTLKTAGEALGMLADRVPGAKCRVDYQKVVHFYVTPAVADLPSDIADVTRSGDELMRDMDSGQVRTRQRGLGMGSALIENVDAGATLLPIDTASAFIPGGGSFKSEHSLGDYTGVHLGGVAAAVLGNVAGPGSSPAAAVASGVVGVLAGVFKYKFAFANAQGETTPGPESAPVTGVAFAAPGAASVGAGSTIGRLIGAFLYKVTNVTALGETTGGTQFSRTATATATPGAPSVAVVDTGVNTDVGRLIGAYGYKITTVDAFGESAASSAGTRTAVAQTAPSAPSAFSSLTDANSVLVAGPLKGTYDWKVAFVGPDGNETLGSSASSTFSGVTPSTPSISSAGPFTVRAKIAFFHPVYGESDWSADVVDSSSTVPVTITLAMLGGHDNIPTGCQWRVASTDNTNTGSGGPFFDVGTAAAGSSSLVYSALGSVVTAAGNTLGRVATFTIPVGPTGTIARRIYRTKQGGSTHFLVGQVGDNSTTTFQDYTPDVSLTVPAPIQNLNGEQHTLSSIATGATGTLKRRIYRTIAGGSVYYLLDEIPDNSTTTYTDNKPDSQLNLSMTAPASSTSGDQHALSSIPIGPTGTLARRIYRTTAGGSAFQFLTELTDNVATTFTDNVADGSLGNFIPLVNTAGANKIDVSLISTGGGSSVTKRIIYRTEAGGSVFKYVATLDDNVGTTYTDNIPDAGLGREALTASTIGAIAGDTTMLLSTVVGWPTAGWLYASNQPIRYTGISGLFLTGIPGTRTVTSITSAAGIATATTSGSHGFATGQFVTVQFAVQAAYNGSVEITVTGATTFTYAVTGSPATPATGVITVAAAGAILGAIAGGTSAITAPFLSGVTGVTYALKRGAAVRVCVVRNDVAAQTALAAIMGGGSTGIIEGPVIDDQTLTQEALESVCDRELEVFSTALRSVTFRSRDVNLQPGKTITITLGGTTNISGTFLIQRVVTNEFDTANNLNPLRKVTAGPVLISLRKQA